MSDEEFISGYLDGRNLDSPEPSGNRSHRYRHSFAVGRAEVLGEKAAEAECLDGLEPPQ